MKSRIQQALLLITAIFITAAFMYSVEQLESGESGKSGKIRSTSSPKGNIQWRAARWEYFHRMLQDPATGKLPPAVHQREMNHAASMPKVGASGRRAPSEILSWSEVGPHDVGGRTRALAVDITNPDVLIAGGVSGGIWKSTNRGETWEMKSTPQQVLSVTCVTQDPRPGHTDTWYYTAGEFRGNSANDRGHMAYFKGNALYRSTDSGESWHPLEWGYSNKNVYSTPFNYASKVLVHPETGSIYVCANGIGILKSDNDGETFTTILGKLNEHSYSDISIATDGTIYALLSAGYFDFTRHSPGVYASADDGVTWENITPAQFTSSYRGVLATPKTNPELVYVLNFTGETGPPPSPLTNYGKEITQFFIVNRLDSTVIDRSENLPDFGNAYNDYINSMFGYAMEMTIKPDDPNLVLIGTASLFRTFDAFATYPEDINQCLIGGYWPYPKGPYPGLHPDIQSFAFDPTDPNALYVGTDGGISYTPNIAESTPEPFFEWESLNNGYNVTQFYTVAIPPEAGDDRIMGGTQDTGTPFLRPGTASRDITSGDGSHCQFTSSTVYASVPRGYLGRLPMRGHNEPHSHEYIIGVKPSEAKGQLFVNPFIVDPANEEVMYYPAGSSMWRNTTLSQIPDGTDFVNGTMAGWSTIEAAELPEGLIYTTLDMAWNEPGDVLYTGAYNTNRGAPKIIRYDSASTASFTPVDISSDLFPDGAYPHDIEVHPDDPDELILLFSNYNIDGLFHSNDGGTTFTSIEGNLSGAEEMNGPSLRNALIQPVADGTLYLVATSTGVYSTTTLNGAETVWELEAPNTLGNVVVSMLKGRTSDGRIAAATHGRGLFETYASVRNAAQAEASVNTLNLTTAAGETADAAFTLTNAGPSPMEYNISGEIYHTAPEGSSVLPSSAHPETGTARIIQSSVRSLQLVPVADRPTKTESSGAGPASDTLIIDDGDDVPDSFTGMQDSSEFGWMNKFEFGSSFRVDAMQFYMRTEEAETNRLNLLFFNEELEPVAGGEVTLATSPDGKWYTVYLKSPMRMDENEILYAGLHTVQSGIQYPAGIDAEATIPGVSYVIDPDSLALYPLSGWEGNDQAAFLIRLIGVAGSGAGSLAEITISPNGGTIEPSASADITVNIAANEMPEGTHEGMVTVRYNGGHLQLPLELTIDPATSVEQEAAIPAEYALGQNFPNPFNPSTTISFSLKEQGFVEINLFSVNGELVRTVTAANYGPGSHEVTLNAEGLSSGVYLYTMRSNEFFDAKKMILLK